VANHVAQNIGPNNWNSGEGLRLFCNRQGANHVAQNINPYNCICYRSAYLYCHPDCSSHHIQTFQKDERGEMNLDNLDEAKPCLFVLLLIKMKKSV